MPKLNCPHVFPLVLALCCTPAVGASALAQDQFIGEQTKLRLSVFQLARDGEYTRWDAMSGEMVVGPGKVINVPIIGVLPIGDRSPDELSTEIAERLQSELGLINLPRAALDVVSYPPIYVVGAVATPGEYNFRPGMTVLQALALGGGQLRSEGAASRGSERIRLLAEMASFESQVMRTSVRVARLEAELAGQDAIETADIGTGQNLEQEQAVLKASRTARDRQVASLVDLQELYQQEIEVLNTRVADLDESIASTEAELAGVQKLVESGMATVSRRSELERLLSSQRSDRLDQLTASMRAKQFMTEAERNADAIEDNRRTELIQQLLIEQAALEKLNLDVRTTRTLLAELDHQLLADVEGERAAEATLSFAIVRATENGMVELRVDEAELLLPADVVKVAMQFGNSSGSDEASVEEGL